MCDLGRSVDDGTKEEEHRMGLGYADKGMFKRGMRKCFKAYAKQLWLTKEVGDMIKLLKFLFWLESWQQTLNWMEFNES